MRGGFPLRALRRDGSGVAALDFGLLAPAWIALVVCTLDFTEAFYLKMRLAAAVDAAAQYAFLNAQTVTASSVASFLANVQTVARASAGLGAAAAVTVLFNNADSDANASNYYCVGGASPVVFTSTGTGSASCGGSVVSGKYVTITVSGTMSTFFSSDPAFGSTIVMSDAAMVRFQ